MSGSLAGRQMQLKAPDVLEARRVGRSAEERSKILDGANVACWVFEAEFANLLDYYRVSESVRSPLNAKEEGPRFLYGHSI